MNPPPESPPDVPPAMHPASAPDCCFRPWLFFGFLVAPGLFSLATLMLTDGGDYGMEALAVLAIGSVIAGFVCGIHFARIQVRLSTGARWAIGVVSVIGCAGVSFALGIGGCLLTSSFIPGL